MDLKDCANELLKKPSLNHQFPPNFNQQKWEDPSILDYGIRIEPQQFSEFNQSSSKPQSSIPCNPSNRIKTLDQEDGQTIGTFDASKIQGWDPSVMLNNLSFLEQTIHQLQDLVHLIVGRRNRVPSRPDELAFQQQQRITADITSIIVQLISTAGSLLPSVKHTLSSTNPPTVQLGGVLFPLMQGFNGGNKVLDQSNQMDASGSCGAEQNIPVEEHESKDEEDVDDGENLPPGSYEILQLEKEEILAPHTHFCMICGKGFKRDANLRMHMRGHGDEYKTPAALAKPAKEANSEPVLIKRYSCPYMGCKRNKDHKKFQPLKTILCVKNHYKRTHCDKSYTCSRCNSKKFSVIADLKTHEKHCGKDRWLCSCGTTFSRKDKLFGHIALFQGHTPAIPLDESKGGCFGPSDRGEINESTSKVGGLTFSFGPRGGGGGGGGSVFEVKGDGGGGEPSGGFFSPMNFDVCNVGGFHEFPRPFDDSENSFSFLINGPCNYARKADDVE